MNDAEHDAWLREALRHAPDSNAQPPSGVSETILLKARAAARAAAPAGRRPAVRAAPASTFAAFWAWLARPPVAAGFASVMAATLVGLMWWDRPMDEAMPRAPAPISERRSDAPLAPPAASTTPAAAAAPKQETVRDSKVAEPAATPPKLTIEPPAKERAPPAERKTEAPAPFPSTEAQREAPTGRSLDAAKKDAERQPAADALARSNATPAPQSTPSRPAPVMSAAPVPAAAPAPTAPLASGRISADESPRADANNADARLAKSAIGGATAGDAPAGERLQRQRALGDEREKETAAFGAAPAAPFRNELAQARPDPSTRSAAPLAGVLAAIAADPTRWSRRSAGGDAFALETGWRTWLSDLDAAAAGRWRSLGGVATSGADADRDGATTLRLVTAGSVAAVVRLEGSTVQLELPAGAGRWQATLSAESADRLRAAARRQSP